MTHTTIITVKEAAKIAADYFADLYAEQEFTDVLLEEIDFDDEEKNWLITIGFSLPATEIRVPGLPTTQSAGRKYKTFEVDAASGEVLRMKIRTVEHA